MNDYEANIFSFWHDNLFSFITLITDFMLFLDYQTKFYQLYRLIEIPQKRWII